MTGEMHRSEVTRESFPCHFNAARKFNGTVEPFDQYQGPYVLIPNRGRYWLCSDDGYMAYWHSEKQDARSVYFIMSRRGASTRAFTALIKSWAPS